MSRKNIDSLGILSATDAALIRSALQNKATRRDVMGWLMAGGLGIATAGSIVTYATQALAETPKKGGRLRVAGSGTSTADTVDPAKQSFSTDYARCNMFYNSLTSLGGEMAPRLALAESIENDKATVWTIKLRKDVAFHDGKKLTADDVVYSLNRHKDPSVGSSAKSLADQMTAIKATGPNARQS